MTRDADARTAAAARGWISGLAAAALAAVVALSPGRAAAVALAIDERWIEQPVSARSLDDLVAALRATGTEEAHARTRVDYEQQATLVVEADGRCVLDDVRLRVRIEVSVPTWSGDAPPAAVATAFERIARGLRLHEAGHVAIAREEAAYRRAALAAAGDFADCRAARRFLLRQQLEFERRVRWRNEAYDRATQRGARQGAVIERRRPGRSARRLG